LQIELLEQVKNPQTLGYGGAGAAGDDPATEIMDPKGESTVSNAAAAGSSGAAQLRPKIAPDAWRPDLSSNRPRVLLAGKLSFSFQYFFPAIQFRHEAALSLPSLIHDTKQHLV